jgi:hypothetical protein
MDQIVLLRVIKENNFSLIWDDKVGFYTVIWCL